VSRAIERPRRDRILSAAEAEFATHGFAGARVERIAAAAGVNKQLLFHYFASKAGLHKAVAEAARSRLDLESTGRGTPGERLRDLVLRLTAATPELGALLGDDTRARAKRAAVRILEDGQRSGHFRDDISPGPVAEVVIAASLGYGRVGAAGPSAGSQATDFAALVARIVADYCAWR
jgi:AcrR family transcriptional regulator